MERILGVIFDIDGVLADSEPLHVRAWQKTLNKYDICLDNQWFKRWIGISDEEMARNLIGKYELSDTKDNILRQKRSDFRKLISTCLNPFDGLSAKLKQIKNIRLGVATSNTRQDAVAIISHLGFGNYFDTIVTSNDVQNVKPSPDCYLFASSNMNVSQKNCVVIEDSPIGLKAAREAGMLAIGVTTTYPIDQLQEADIGFATTCEAIDWIIKQCSLSKAVEN